MKYFFLLLILLVSCSKEYLSSEELQAFVRNEENGLRQIKQVGGYKVEVTYRPTDLWVNQEIGDHPTDKSNVEALRKKYSNYYYFILSLSRDNKEALHSLDGGMGQYSELVQVMSFRMADYVTMTTNKSDTIPVGDFILNRTYGLSSSTDLLFVFSKEKARNKEWVQFNLNEFGLGIGNQRFRFKRKALDNTPAIIFSLINNEQPSQNFGANK